MPEPDPDNDPTEPVYVPEPDPDHQEPPDDVPTIQTEPEDD